MATEGGDAMSGKPRGRMLCAWCGRDLGPRGTDADSHGICADCERKLRQQAGLGPQEKAKA